MSMNRCLINVALAIGACGLLAPLMPGVTALAQSRRQQPHPGHEQGSGHGHGPATTETYFFFALQEVPQAAVSTITTAQRAFTLKFGDKVQINNPSGLHVSVVRLGTIADTQAAQAFDSAQEFVNHRGNVNFHFHNAQGTSPVIKNEFVSYNVYLARDSTDFKTYAEDLAKHVNTQTGIKAMPEESQTHISILHYNDDIKSEIDNFITPTRSSLPPLTLEYTPSRLVLLETSGSHQYRVATVRGQRAEIHIPPKK